MRFFILISLAFIFCSCSSISKFGERKYFKVKTIRNMNNDSKKYESYQFLYFESRDDETCFKDNPKNKETITVAEEHLKFALDYFYKRVATVNVTINKRSNHRDETKFEVIEVVPFKLEIAECLTYYSRSRPWYDDDPVSFVSFRLAD